MRSARLDNGLEVIAHEMHHAPVAAFSVWYRVGSRNEVPGITGISHWVEHMMFKGTARFGKGTLDRLISSRGGSWNGFTTEDFTAYYELLPSDHLELAMDIEADRMANCLFDGQEVESERTVIVSEREGAENYPTFWLEEATGAACWSVHPYRQGVIGAKCDLRGMTRDDLWAHYRAYYGPDNAVIVAVGDFVTSDLLRLVETKFGGIPPGQPRRPLRSVEPPQEGQRRVKVLRPGPAGYFLALHHVPEAAHPDVPALLCLQAALAGGRSPIAWLGRQMGRSSRLYRRLVLGGLAVTVEAAVQLRADPSVFSVSATAAPGVPLERLEEQLSAELCLVQEEDLAPEELLRAKKQVRAQFAYTRAGVLGHAMWLGFWSLVEGQPYADGLGELLGNVGPGDVRRVARRYLCPRNSTVGWFVAEPDEDRTAAGPSPAKPPARARTPRWWARSEGPAAPWPGARGPRSLPGAESIARQALPNGAVVTACRNSGVDHVELMIRLPAGGAAVHPDQAGLAEYAARGSLLGTARRPMREFHELLDRLGASLTAESGPDATLWRASCLPEDLVTVTGLILEAVREPAFPAHEMGRLGAELETHIRERDQDTARLARRIALELAYPGGHPYGQPPLGHLSTLAALGLDEVRAFQTANYGPRGAVVAAVGPFEPRQTAAELQAAVAVWPPGPSAAPEAGRLAPRAAGRRPPGGRKDVYLPGKSQTDIALALPVMPRHDPDYEGFDLLNLILGRVGLGGRIAQRVRDELGLAYYCYSWIVERVMDGPWMLSAGVSPSHLELALRTIREEIARIRREPVSPRELEEALGYARGSLFLDVESAEGLAAWLVRLEVYGLGLDYLARYPERLARLSAQDLLDLARRYLDEERVALAVAGPERDGGEAERSGPGTDDRA